MTALEVTAETYHADELGDTPTLSASVASILCQASPAHARAAHPKLNPNYRRSDEAKFDIGTCVHSLLLEGIDKVHIVNADDWRTRAAQEDRDLARAAGRVPLLLKQWDEVQAMVAAVHEQLAALAIDPAPFTEGRPEQTIVWQENGVWCRARLDWLRDDLTAIFDLKTTSRSASPFRWGRTLFDTGADLQCAFYRRAVQSLTGHRPEYRWVVVETAAPYAVSVFAPTAELLDLGDAKVDHALKVWAECLAADHWPAYGPTVTFVDVPGYEMARWMEKEMAA